ncbi:DUF962 domain-containing protein [Ferrimonas balearica]|uniref:DUF962 domain-containing protein n=1 Tax=Ferrimonas balearica TaxID=44012 RepID=UPI001F2A2D09|nr:DUF962 domain-containing protein [Ferrimonas balearica]MBY6093371.1 DUF962 domain-containing protein [Ferrimonas balearica]
MSTKRFTHFAEFYPFYLREHSDARCRALHYTGSILVLLCLGFILASGRWTLLWLLPVIGYGFAWVGHFGFGHNKPATFQYPFYSLAADWVMLKDWMTGQLDAKLADALARK